MKAKALCGHVFICKWCRKIASPFAGTFFAQRRVSLVILFQLMSLFLLYVEQSTAALVLNLDEHTVGRLFNLSFRCCMNECDLFCLLLI